MNNLIKKLSGNELKIFFILLYNCNKNYEFTPIDDLTDYELTHPTVHKIVERLKDLGIIDIYDLGNRSLLKLKPQFKLVSDYLKNFSLQLELLEVNLDDIQKKNENKVSNKDIFRLLYYYGLKIGVPEDKIKDWVEINKMKYIKSARKILSYLKDIEKAFTLIDNTKLYHESRNLSWSMNGVMLTDIEKLSNLTLAKKDGSGKWF